MARKLFRFLHTADWQLDQAFHGIAEISDSIRDLLVDAPIDAAERVFAAAIEHEVSFVVLTGNILSRQATSPRAIAFLLDWFERLGEHGIAVYWSMADVENIENWFSSTQLPKNVHVIPKKSAVPIRHRRDDQLLASLFGVKGADENESGELDLTGGVGFQIAVAHGHIDEKQVAKSSVDYWAVGPMHQNGRYQQQTIVKSGKSIHYPGTHQGRSPNDTGPRGCTLVTVDEDGIARLEALPTSAVCWHAETIEVDDSVQFDKLKQKLGDRMLELAEEAGDRTSLVNWRIEGPCGSTDRLLDWLRNEFGKATPALWTVAVDVELSRDVPAQWRAEDTLLGDFLRGIDQLKDDSETPIELQRFLSAELAESLACAVQLNDPIKRRQVLREATSLGVELFRGKEAA